MTASSKTASRASRARKVNHPEGIMGDAQTLATESGDVCTFDAVQAPTVAPDAPTGTPDAPTFAVRFIDALTARNAEQYSRDTDLAISAVRGSADAVNRTMSLPAFAEVADELVRGARQARQQEGKRGFIAVKVLVKIAHALRAIGHGQRVHLDGYTRTIVGAMLHLQAQAQGITNKSALVSLSKSIEYDALDTVQALQRRSFNCSVGTASTQASSSRMMLHYLSICTVRKGQRGDVMTFNDTDRARALTSLFTVATAQQESEPEDE